MLTIVLSTVIVLGILIFVHELGHFLVAKRSRGDRAPFFAGLWTENIRYYPWRN